MWVCDITIMMDPNNPDKNSITDVVAGLVDMGAVVGVVDADQNLIEAAVPSHLVHVVGAFEGVSYVRTVFQYFATQWNPPAAQPAPVVVAKAAGPKVAAAMVPATASA